MSIKKLIFFVLFFTLFTPSPSKAQNVVFSPTANPGNTFTFDINAGFRNIRTWRFEISLLDAPNHVRVFEGEGHPPQEIIWNGKDSAGNIVPCGIYAGVLYVILRNQTHSIENAQVIIDTTPPLASITIHEDISFLKDGTLTQNFQIHISASDENGIDFSRTNLTIFTDNHRQVKSYFFGRNIPAYIIWDGRSNHSTRVMPPGYYRIVFSVFDIAGNSSFVNSEIFIVPFVEPQSLHITDTVDTDENMPEESKYEKKVATQ